jgi:hypothetical protein
MEGQQTTIYGPDKEHNFRYDYSFWSHTKEDAHFADQEMVFRCMGIPLLNRAFQGYNCCLFAYGQTGNPTSTTCGVVWPRASCVCVCAYSVKLCAARAQTKDCLHRVDSGSGKSYTMMGEKNNRGIIPRFSEEMWNKIQAKPDVDCKVGSVPFVLAPFFVLLQMNCLTQSAHPIRCNTAFL